MLKNLFGFSSKFFNIILTYVAWIWQCQTWIWHAANLRKYILYIQYKNGFIIELSTKLDLARDLYSLSTFFLQCRMMIMFHRCAAEGCTWRVHASKLPQVNTFRVRTLTPEHTCERSGDGGHRQATAKWIANCIREKLRQNRSYKPREILNDIHREYGVLITYKRAFLGREKALEELRIEPERNMGPIEHNYESMSENSTEAWGEIHNPPRRKRVCRPSDPKEVRPVHCTRCNQIGHNRRTCTVIEFLDGKKSTCTCSCVLIYNLLLLHCLSIGLFLLTNSGLNWADGSS